MTAIPSSLLSPPVLRSLVAGITKRRMAVCGVGGVNGGIMKHRQHLQSGHHIHLLSSSFRIGPARQYSSWATSVSLSTKIILVGSVNDPDERSWKDSRRYASNVIISDLASSSESIHSQGGTGQSRSMSSLSSSPFPNESEYHSVADETLEDIQDVVEFGLESTVDNLADEFEVVYANGVLTMVFPPHGTWVLNKQTPNRQIWWSSPLSGPRRYEYDPDADAWVYTRSSDSGDSSPTSLQQDLKQEIIELYNVELDL